MRFRKYQALGNDYLVLELDGVRSPSAALVRRLCDRHYGLGADGVLLADPESAEPFGLRIFNPDGSEAEKSGNGLRIFARYLWDTGKVAERPFGVSTPGGVVRCCVQDGGRRVAVDMGQASFASDAIPVAGGKREVVDEALEVAGETVRFTGVGLGNPHCVVHRTDVSAELALRLGPLIERHEMFPNRTNVQFVRVVDPHRLEVEIWERGAGYTLSSGSSSCAAAAASVRLGLCAHELGVAMPGGELSISVSPDFLVRMTGPAEQIAEGTIAPELLEAVVD